jgi:hypothetical protein
MYFSVIHLLAANVGDNAATSVLERLDPPKRAAVVMALLGLVLTGLVLVTCAMLGAHWVRRLARHRPGTKQTRTISRSPAENKRLRDALESVLPSAKSSDTVQLDSSTSDTIVDPSDR